MYACALWQVSSIEIERICNAVDSNVLETAAIGVPPPEGGPEQLVVAVVFKDSASATDLNQLRVSFNSAVQKKLNPLFRVLILSMTKLIFCKHLILCSSLVANMYVRRSLKLFPSHPFREQPLIKL